MQFSQLISESAGALLGGFLAVYSLALPFKLQAILSWCPLIIALTLVEATRETLDRTQHKENFMLVFRHIFFGDSAVRTSFLQLLVWGLSTFMAVWTFQKYWEEQNVPLAYFGALWASANLVAAIASKYAAHMQVKIGRKASLLLSCAFPVIGYFGMGLSAGVVGVIFGFFLYIGRGLIQVNFREEFNHYLPNQFRATANSIQSFCFRGVFALIGPLVGLNIDVHGLDQTLMILGLFFFAWYLFAFKKLWKSK